ncbi:hypothetical protein AOXY_G3550 [Acipenser oxyrinchus oxyrinchus]|uniref:Uncharacterized protein n=1 Tax=Acipenser oxyrinchus oxyrinchus TaxID=40147 RepID=A0AAD8GFZ1_ACIOX|nr:hypothetical protein AOXY_G3550 [Acipenser oxyrinchus oxyrinchus]
MTECGPSQNSEDESEGPSAAETVQPQASQEDENNVDEGLILHKLVNISAPSLDMKATILELMKSVEFKSK